MRILSRALISESGQVMVVLLLTMLVALTVGLTVTQRSITDLSTSTQNEQASRAFSAAEAGIEKAIEECPIEPQGGNPCPYRTGGDQAPAAAEFSFGNDSKAQIVISEQLPRPGQALEYPPVDKETVAQFWLAVIGTPASNATEFYRAKTINVFFGNAEDEPGDLLPAIEIDLITKLGNEYKSRKYFYDTDPARTSGLSSNGFTPCSGEPVDINTSNSVDPNKQDRSFKCKITLPPSGSDALASNEFMVLLRARILYSNAAQPVAVQPIPGSNILPQATIYTAVGSAGQSQKTIQVFKVKNVVPSFFDYAVFSAGDIDKSQ